MGHKRRSEQGAKSCKRRKSYSPNVENGRKYLIDILKKSGEELGDSSSEISTDSCPSGASPSTSSSPEELAEDCDVQSSVTTSVQCLAIDCEMVGVGPQRSSALGRCSVVNCNGEILFDAFVQPEQPVTDYRTKWSGIRESDLREAITFKKARKQVKKLIKNCVLIGHSMHCDLHALNLLHPWHLLRDTSRYYPIRSLAGLPMNTTPSLKDLSNILLSEKIQDNEHCSVEDARAAMSLYKLCEQQWEKELKGELSTESYLSDLYWPAWTRTGHNAS